MLRSAYRIARNRVMRFFGKLLRVILFLATALSETVLLSCTQRNRSQPLNELVIFGASSPQAPYGSVQTIKNLTLIQYTEIYSEVMPSIPRGVEALSVIPTNIALKRYNRQQDVRLFAVRRTGPIQPLLICGSDTENPFQYRHRAHHPMSSDGISSAKTASRRKSHSALPRTLLYDAPLPVADEPLRPLDCGISYHCADPSTVLLYCGRDGSMPKLREVFTYRFAFINTRRNSYSSRCVSTEIELPSG